MTRSTTQSSKRFAWVVAALMAVASCSGGSDDASPTTLAPPNTVTGIDGNTGSSGTEGLPSRADGGLAQGAMGGELAIRLSEGAAATAAPVSLVSGTPLDAAQVAAVLERLPEWDVPDDDQVDFNRPTDSLKPPVPGDTVAVAFPPPTPGGTPTDVPDGPLEVLRFQPEGDVALAPFLSVTFNQPMVALTTLEQLDVKDVPAVLTPDVPGRWRWIGTRTLRFEVEPGQTDRLPMATEFRVEIPAGTTSATGNELPETVAWEFATPAPIVQSVVPQGESLQLTPVFVAVFDQIVDPDAVLATARLNADGDEQPIRLATSAEIDDDDDARQATQRALDGRWIAFRADSALPVDSDISIEIGPGTPSMEGPLTTADPQKFSARTYAPLPRQDEELRLRSGWHLVDRVQQPARPGGVRHHDGVGRAGAPRAERERLRIDHPDLGCEQRSHRLHGHVGRRSHRCLRPDVG